MAKQPGAQLHIDTAGGMGKQARAQTRQHDLEQDDHQQADSDHVERGETAMHKHLVHHHLEEQRGDQCEYLQHRRHHHHFA